MASFNQEDVVWWFYYLIVLIWIHLYRPPALCGLASDITHHNAWTLQ